MPCKLYLPTDASSLQQEPETTFHAVFDLRDKTNGSIDLAFHAYL